MKTLAVTLAALALVLAATGCRSSSSGAAAPEVFAKAHWGPGKTITEMQATKAIGFPDKVVQRRARDIYGKPLKDRYGYPVHNNIWVWRDGNGTAIQFGDDGKAEIVIANVREDSAKYERWKATGQG
jgi:hypothetical protein